MMYMPLTGETVTSDRNGEYWVTGPFGMTYPPAVRSSIVQTLGLATIVMCLATARGPPGNRYAQKWFNAFVKTFAHIKDAENIAGTSYDLLSRSFGTLKYDFSLY